MFTISTELILKNKVSKIFNWLIVCIIYAVTLNEPYFFFYLSRTFMTTPT